MKRFFFYYYFEELSRIKLNYVSKIITIMQINVRNVWACIRVSKEKEINNRR